MTIQTNTIFGVSRRALFVFGCVVVAPFIVIALLNWLGAQDNEFYHRPTVTQSTLHALKRVAHVILHPADCIRDSWDPMLQAFAAFKQNPGGDIYRQLFFADGVRFQYPPSSLLLLDALALLFGDAHLTPLVVADVLMLFVLSGVVGWIAHLSLGAEARTKAGRAFIFIGGAAATFLFYPAIHAVNLGQIQIWIDVFVALAVVAFLRDRRMISGALLALACLFKPQAAIFLIWALAWRDWAFVKGFLALAVPAAVASLARYGLQNHLAYLDVLSFLSRHGESFYANNALNGVLNRLAGNGVNLIWQPGAFPATIGWIYVSGLVWSLALMAGLLAIPFWRGGRSTLPDFAAAAAVSVVSAPVAWEHHYGILLPFFPPLLALAWRLGAGARATGALAVSFILLANYMPVTSRLAETWLNPLQANFFFGGLFFLWAAAELARLPQQQRAGRDIEQSDGAQQRQSGLRAGALQD